MTLKCNLCGAVQTANMHMHYCKSQASRTVDQIAKQPQRQDSVLDQLRDLMIVANRLGMCDAANFLARTIECQPKSTHSCQECHCHACEG